MEELGNITNTDKITHHGYHRFYPQFIDFIKNINNAGIIEIGIDQGKSALLWLNYFPNINIYGLDINLELTDNRIKIIKCDQSQIEDLKNAKKQINHKIYLINDDGSHIPEHQILSFNYLFKNLLEEDGIYIIEDIETSYWKRNGLYGYNTKYGYRTIKYIIEKFKDVFDYINREFINLEDKNDLCNRLILSGFDIETLNMISFITICHNCIIIKKIKNEDAYKFGNRHYRFYENI